MKRFFVPSLVLSLVALAAPAGAQITQRSEGKPAAAIVEKTWIFETNDEPDGYGVEFNVESIDASLNDGSIPRIVVRPVRGFGQLARPRTHFVPELLKSIEVM